MCSWAAQLVCVKTPPAESKLNRGHLVFPLIDYGKSRNALDLDLHVESDIISPVSVVRDLGVLIDSELLMKQHLNKTVSICNYQLRRLKQVRRILGPDIAARLVSAYIVGRLDYCNSVLAGLPQKTIAPLHRVQNAAASLISSLGPRNASWSPLATSEIPCSV